VVNGLNDVLPYCLVSFNDCYKRNLILEFVENVSNVLRIKMRVLSVSYECSGDIIKMNHSELPSLVRFI